MSERKAMKYPYFEEEGSAGVVNARMAPDIMGSLPEKADNPAVPITVSEQLESTQEAFEAGASIARCHVRNDDESQSSDPEKFCAASRRLAQVLPRHPAGKRLTTTGRVRADNAVSYLASVLDCRSCVLKPICCPNVASRRIPRDIHEDARDVARRKMTTKAFRKSRDERKRVEIRNLCRSFFNERASASQ